MTDRDKRVAGLNALSQDDLLALTETKSCKGTLEPRVDAEAGLRHRLYDMGDMVIVDVMRKHQDIVSVHAYVDPHGVEAVPVNEKYELLRQLINATHEHGAVLRIRSGKLSASPAGVIPTETRAEIGKYKDDLVHLMTVPHPTPKDGATVDELREHLMWCWLALHAWDGPQNKTQFSSECDSAWLRWIESESTYCEAVDREKGAVAAA